MVDFPGSFPSFPTKTLIFDTGTIAPADYRWNGIDINQMYGELSASLTKIGIDGDTNPASFDYRIAALEAATGNLDHAKMWWVSTDGDDPPTGTGGLGKPFLTVQDGVDAASDGDVIVVNSGAYLEDVTVTKQIVIFGWAGAIIRSIEINAPSKLVIVRANVSGTGSTPGLYVIDGDVKFIGDALAEDAPAVRVAATADRVDLTEAKVLACSGTGEPLFVEGGDVRWVGPGEAVATSAPGVRVDGGECKIDHVDITGAGTNQHAVRMNGAGAKLSLTSCVLAKGTGTARSIGGTADEVTAEHCILDDVVLSGDLWQAGNRTAAGADPTYSASNVFSTLLASRLANDSTVPGDWIDEALDYLKTAPGSSNREIAAQFVIPLAGALAVANDVSLHIEPYDNFEVEEIRAIVKGAPSGAGIRLNVRKNGTSFFTTPAYLEIPDGNTEGTYGGTLTGTSLVKDDLLTVDITQVGSTVAGSNLSVLVRGKVLSEPVPPLDWDLVLTGADGNVLSGYDGNVLVSS